MRDALAGMTLTAILLAICLSLGQCHYSAYKYPHSSKNDVRKMKDRQMTYSDFWADIEEFPSTVFLELTHWLVADDVEEKHWCGGSIINLKWVITAAHCLECCPGIEDRYYTLSGFVFAGSNRTTNIRLVQDLVEYVIHSSYRYPSANEVAINNIGLVKVEFRFPLGSRTIEAALLPQSNRALRPGNIATSAGLGLPWLQSTPLEIMMKANMVVIHREECVKELRNQWRVDYSQLCMVPARKEENLNVSIGDCGNPVYVEGGMLVGVVSWTLPGRNMDIIGSTNVAYYRDWIRDIAGI